MTFRCSRPLSEERLRVQLWVRIEELAIVTSMRTEARFEDLTLVTLMQGVPVRATGERGPRGRLFEIEAEGIRLVLPLPEDRLGRSYYPTLEVAPVEIAAAPRPRVRVGGQTILGDVSVDLAPLAPTVLGRLAEVRSSCLDMIAWAAEEVEPQPAPRRQGNPVFDRGDRPEERLLGEDVELRWLDGSPAGVTTGPVQADGGRFGERFCFDVLDGDTDPPLVLCAPVAELPPG